MAKTPFSKIIAGIMTWEICGKNLNKNQGIELMNPYVESGIRTFDHTDIYDGCTTETAFGNAFGKSRIDRKKTQLISKCGIQLLSENRNKKIKHYDYCKSHIISSAKQPLRI